MKVARFAAAWFVGALACASSAAALAQAPAPVAALMPELAPASFLLGRWQGGGWIEFAPGQRRAFSQFESISAKLGGGAIVMEGLGTRKGDDGSDVVTHEALGIVTYDARQKKPLFRAYRTGGQFVDAAIALAPDRLTWQFQLQGVGITRYSIVLDEQGRWFEIGELSKDGAEWRKFFETTLTRVEGPKP